MTAIIASGTALIGFGSGLFYAVRRIPHWLAGMTPSQIEALITKAEQIRADA